MQTIAYKQGFIHFNFMHSPEIIRVQVDAYAYAVQVKSAHQAKIWITEHAKKYTNKPKARGARK